MASSSIKPADDSPAELNLLPLIQPATSTSSSSEPSVFSTQKPPPPSKMKYSVSTLYPNAQVATNVTAYCEAHSQPLPRHLAEYHDEIDTTRKDAFYMISNFEAQYLIWFGKMMGVKRVLEIGVHVGYSAMVWAEAAGKGGKVVGLEFNPEYAEIARKSCTKYGVDNVEIIDGNALETLPTHTPTEPYDVIFIDADKLNYHNYLETVLARSSPDTPPEKRLLRAGGLIIADNCLRMGMPADSSDANPYRFPSRDDPASYFDDDDIAALRKYNDTVQGTAGGRLYGFVMPLWDGVNFAKLLD